MEKYSADELLEKLKDFDTPTLTNAIAVYPDKKKLCLSIYDPWEDNWYTDSRIKCIFPELGRLDGYAVTATFGLPGADDISFKELYRALYNSPKPSVLCIRQDFPEKYKMKNGLAGGNMVSAFKSLGCVGLITDGPSRDIDEVREKHFQYMLTGVTAGHGPFSLKSVNTAVEICGMEVEPGNIIHMDENGAVKFPAEKIEAVYENCLAISSSEKIMQKLFSENTDPDILYRIREGNYKDLSL